MPTKYVQLNWRKQRKEPFLRQICLVFQGLCTDYWMSIFTSTTQKFSTLAFLWLNTISDLNIVRNCFECPKTERISWKKSHTLEKENESLAILFGSLLHIWFGNGTRATSRKHTCKSFGNNFFLFFIFFHVLLFCWHFTNAFSLFPRSITTTASNL